MGMDRKIEKKRWTLRRLIYLVVGTIVVGLIVYQLFGDNSPKLNVEMDRLTIGTVKQGEFQDFLPLTGSVVPIRTVYLDAVEGGQVDTIYLEAGSMVAQGDTILRLSNTNLLLDIMYREAELFQQSNNLRNTRLAMEQNRLALETQILELDHAIENQARNYETANKLKEKDLIAQQTWEEARDTHNYLKRKRDLTMKSFHADSLFRATQIQQLEEGLERMRGNLGIVKQNLDRLVLRAPVSGQLTSLNAEVGESKVRGERLGQVDILDGFKIRAQVDEYYITRISTGLRGQFDLSGQSYALSLDKIYPEVVNGQFAIEMAFPTGEPVDIRRGQTIRFNLEMGESSEQILLARGSHYQTTGGRWIYRLSDNEKEAMRVPIRLGRQNRDYFEVLEGLAPGDRVITSGYDNFGDIERLVLQQDRRK
ncbi:MAG TPA: hypothetical protein DHU63_02070 [Candidatus Marinimicrobia bacterium]|nr:MAG: hypothetical protein COY19_02995 [Candidatus Marinimicrobia bacterium CG_4_10_14_0_2_um_filter_48_9]PJA55109.1 MAG: hypothetical protein CO167_00065 [Candidatus Marinimicrobia bacterium CG_4_9_14_3_um_filter_48_9]HCW75306.1 hypothetical protein [Candidatus Neomarinimicrobiota bacterium]